MSSLGPVVVGVDGSEADRAAIPYGAGEARRHRSDLVLVHVIPTFVPINPAMPVLEADLRVMGQEVLTRAADVARTHLDGDSPQTTLREGSRAAELLHQAETAQLLVLGSTPRSRVERLVTGSILAGVASRAACPVIAVPQDWSPTSEPRPVVAGVKSVDQSQALLDRAVQIAAASRSRLILVHAWEFPVQYDDVFRSRGMGDEVAKGMREALEHSVAGLADDVPEVPIQIRVVHGQPARVLQLMSDEADLILLTRRPRAFPRGHLGGTGRALLRSAHCPVEVLPLVEHTTDVPGPALEDGDGIMK